jgi:hypothetical protein
MKPAAIEYGWLSYKSYNKSLCKYEINFQLEGTCCDVADHFLLGVGGLRESLGFVSDSHH